MERNASVPSQPSSRRVVAEHLPHYVEVRPDENGLLQWHPDDLVSLGIVPHPLVTPHAELLHPLVGGAHQEEPPEHLRVVFRLPVGLHRLIYLGAEHLTEVGWRHMEDRKST